MGFFFQKEMKTINMSKSFDENYWQEKNGVVLMQSFPQFCQLWPKVLNYNKVKMSIHVYFLVTAILYIW